MSIDEVFEFGCMSTMPGREAMYDIWLGYVKSGLNLLGTKWNEYMPKKINVWLQYRGFDVAINSWLWIEPISGNKIPISRSEFLARIETQISEKNRTRQALRVLPLPIFEEIAYYLSREIDISL